MLFSIYLWGLSAWSGWICLLHCLGYTPPSIAENSLRTEPPGPQGLTPTTWGGVVLDTAAASQHSWRPKLPGVCWCVPCRSSAWGPGMATPSAKYLPDLPGQGSTYWFILSSERHPEALLSDCPRAPSGRSLCPLLCPEQFCFRKQVHMSTRHFYPGSANTGAIRGIQDKRCSTIQ